MGSTKHNVEALVVDNLSVPVLLGVDTLKKFGAYLDFDKNIVSWRNQGGSRSAQTFWTGPKDGMEIHPVYLTEDVIIPLNYGATLVATMQGLHHECLGITESAERSVGRGGRKCSRSVVLEADSLYGTSARG